MKRIFIWLAGIALFLTPVALATPANAHSSSFGPVYNACSIPGGGANLTQSVGPIDFLDLYDSNGNHRGHTTEIGSSADNVTRIRNYSTGRVTVRVRTYVGGSSPDLLYQSSWHTLHGKNSGSAAFPGYYDQVNLPVVLLSHIGDLWLPEDNPRTIVDYYRTDNHTADHQNIVWWRYNYATSCHYDV